MAKQAEHSEENCRINQIPNVSPADDCGHTVNEGPGVGVPKYEGNDSVVKAGDAKKGEE